MYSKNVSKIFDFFMVKNCILLEDLLLLNRFLFIECFWIEKEYMVNDGKIWKFVKWGEIKVKDLEDGKLK